MSDKVPCPDCGAANYLTDDVCLSCGADLRPRRSLPIAEAPVTPRPAPACVGPTVAAFARAAALVGLVVAPLLFGSLWLLGAALALTYGPDLSELNRLVGALALVWIAFNAFVYAAAGSRLSQGPAGARELPAVVHVARLMALIAIACLLPTMVLCATVGLAASEGGASPNGPFLFLWFLFSGAMLALYLWLIVALGRSSQAAWVVQLVLAALWAAGGFPIGTVVAGVLLYYWLQPETKAWFGMT